MPNGGVPLHLVLKPAASPEIVVHCEGAKMSVYEHADWADEKSDAPAESQVLARFLRYWLHDHDEGVIYREPGVHARYDF